MVVMVLSLIDYENDEYRKDKGECVGVRHRMGRYHMKWGVIKL